MNYSEKKTSDFSHHFTPKRKYMHIPKTFNPGLSKRTFNESLEKKNEGNPCWENLETA